MGLWFFLLTLYEVQNTSAAVEEIVSVTALKNVFLVFHSISTVNKMTCFPAQELNV